MSVIVQKFGGTSVQDVNRLMKNYEQMKKMMKKMGKRQPGKGTGRSLGR